MRDVREFWQEALVNLKKAQARVKERYNVGSRQVHFRVEDFVMLRLHPLSSKSQQRSLANPDTGVIVRKAHVSQLKKHLPPG
ncbi:hypothetical protein B7P43_G17731 [Cryptotermes secundus]|uniref:Uncharacterized protein n=1 Tax=Cryptotermes secundus TaxID=105785 RepID=A0A2J7PYE7_9NEOP|nr:hypothetical protein B7P43_G17731 [Cryptotermes secundus]